MEGMEADFVGLVQGRAKQTGVFSTKDGHNLAGHIAKAAGSINESDHSINFVISSEVIDRHGEVVKSDAVARAIKAFGRNPVALAVHSHRSEDGSPTVVGSWDVGTFRKFKDHCEMRLRFAVDTRLGAEYWKLYSQGHMRAVSIAFRILDSHHEDTKAGRIHYIDEIELYEISCVPVPACQDALAKSKERKRAFVAEKRGFVIPVFDDVEADDEQKADEFARALLDWPIDEKWEDDYAEDAEDAEDESELDIDLALLVAG